MAPPQTGPDSSQYQLAPRSKNNGACWISAPALTENPFLEPPGPQPAGPVSLTCPPVVAGAGRAASAAGLRGGALAYSQAAASAAQYVKTMSAPALRMLVNDSNTAARRSIQPLAAAAEIIAYSPDT